MTGVRGRVAIALPIVAVLATGMAFAQETRDESRTARGLARELMSPFCPGRTLADCPSPDATAARQEIREMLAAGSSEEQVRRNFEERYGLTIRGVPLSAWGWGIPIALLVVGGAVLGLALRRLAGRQAVAPAAPADSDLERELDAEIRERGL
jgi:cytochrome c-type biogenesis protein CcmH